MSEELHKAIALLDTKPETVAARPQGEPVLYVARDSIDDPECDGMHATRKRNELQCVPLYAEQPPPVEVQEYQNKINHLKQLLRNVRATLHFSPEDVLAIDAALREEEE